MGTYVTIATVRRTCGITSTSTISDVDVEATITEVESQVPRYFNTVFTPTERIDILDGTGNGVIFSEKNPLLALREIKIYGTSVTPAYAHVHKESGKIELGASAEQKTFLTKTPLDVALKYIYGMVEYSSTSTTTSAASTAGTTVSLSVASITGFADTNWCEIFGTDGYREAFQISGSPAGTTIVADQLVYSHASGSTIKLYQVSPNFTKLMNIISGIALVARVVGQSATDLTGYTLTEFTVQKGEPYTQWRETAVQLIRERDEMMKRINIRPAIY